MLKLLIMFIGVVIVVPQMVRNAKALTMDPRNVQNGQAWRRENDSVCILL